MCLATEQKMAMKADKDIECYKVVLVGKDDVLISLVIGKTYEVGGEYTESRFVSNIADLFEGFWWLNETYNVEFGFHSYSEYNNAIEHLSYADYHGYHVCMIRCEIPKGSLYYRSISGGEYCSDRIKVVEIVG